MTRKRDANIIWPTNRHASSEFDTGNCSNGALVHDVGEFAVHHPDRPQRGILNLTIDPDFEVTMELHNSRVSQIRFIRAAVIALLVYWTAYAVIVPVTVWDSHTYNLARLLIVNYGGFFGNTVWNSERQIAYPWSFDAIHFPFLLVGWGYSLPSYLCFIGLMLIVFRMVKTRFDERTAWYSSLAILALPTVMFQATSTKNDFGVVFGVACWAYAMWRFQQERLRRFLYLATLSLGFAAGAKASGVPLALLLSAYTAWYLRSEKRMIVLFFGFLTLNFVLFGSLETYMNNRIIFGNFFGPQTITSHSNQDGLEGMVANFIRYTIGSTDPGVDLANPHSHFTVWLQDLSRKALNLMHLENKGCYYPDFSDTTLEFLRNGWEGGSAYGPLGTISLWVAFGILFTRPTRDVLWRLSLAGLGSLLIICAMVSWVPWNLRFLMLSFLLFTLATTILIVGPEARSVFGRRAFLFVTLIYAVLFPIYSFNKSPRDLWQSVTNREKMTMKERSSMLEIVDDLKARREQIGRSPVFLTAGSDSWVLPILQIRDLKVIPTPQIDLTRLQNATRQYASDSIYILTLNHPLVSGLNAELIKTFSESDTLLLKWHNPQAAPESVSVAFTFTTGWYPVEHTGADWLCWTDGRGQLKVAVTNDALATLSGQIFSAPRPNDVDVLLNGAKVSSLRIDWSKWEFRNFQPLNLALKTGDNTLELISHNPGIKIGTDSRTLAVAVKNLSLTTLDK